MCRTTPTRAVAALAALAVSTALLTSCTSTEEPLDTTFAVLTAPGPPGEAHRADVDLVIEAATAAEGTLILSTVGDNTAESIAFHATMAGEGANKLERDKSLAAKQEALGDVLTDVATRAESVVHDVLLAFETLAGNLGASEGPVHVIVTAPLVSGGMPDLGDPAVLADIEAALNDLAAQGRIPDCEGWLIYGVGESATSAPLREFYRLYAERCGGKLVAFTTRLVDFPLESALEAPDYEQIDVDEEGEAAVATVRDVVFEYGSAEISPDAEASLQELLLWLQTNPGAIEIVGHTDERGDPAANLVLGEQRAVSIATWLGQHGIPAERIVSVRGAGEAEPLHPGATTEAEHRENRRTVVTVHPIDD